MLICPLVIQNISRWPLRSFPVTFGLPLPAGKLAPNAPISLRSLPGDLYPAQTRCLASHADGSVHRLLLTAEPPLAGQARSEFEIIADASEQAGTISWDGVRSAGASINVERRDDTLVFARGEQVWCLDLEGSLSLSDNDSPAGGTFRVDGVSVTDCGPVMLRLDIAGAVADGTQRLLDVDLAVQVFARTPVVMLDIVATNRGVSGPVRVRSLEANLRRDGGSDRKSTRLNSSHRL